MTKKILPLKKTLYFKYISYFILLNYSQILYSLQKLSGLAKHSFGHAQLMVATVINLLAIRLLLLIKKTFLMVIFHPFLSSRIDGSVIRYPQWPFITVMRDGPRRAQAIHFSLHPPGPTWPVPTPHLEGP